jgi:hypothetical protein
MAEAETIYTTANLIKVLIATVSTTAALVIYFLNRFIQSAERREEKIDHVLEQLGNKVTDLEKYRMVQEFAADVVEARLFKLENRVDKLEDGHRK